MVALVAARVQFSSTFESDRRTRYLFKMDDGNACHSEEADEKPEEGSSDDELLIQLVKGQKGIWAIQSRGHKDIQKKNEAWEVIAPLIGKDADICDHFENGVNNKYLYVECISFSNHTNM